MRGHAGERQCSGGLHQDHRAPTWRPVCVTPEVRANAWGADNGTRYLMGSLGFYFWVCEVEGARHGLETEGVVVHVQRCEGDGVGASLRRPPCGRLDGAQHL
jgi:hypothetical protein